MKDKKIIKLVFAMIIITVFAVICGKTYAKYILTKNSEITLSSLPFYFEVSSSSNSVGFKKATNDSTTFNIVVSNNDGENYNSYNTTYEISMVDNEKYTFNEGNSVTKTIEGGSLKNDTVTLNLKIKNLESPLKNFSIKVKSTSPYVKEQELTFEVVQGNAIQTIEDLIDLSIYVNEGKAFKGEIFTLMRDLDFTDPDSYENAYRTDYQNVNGDSLTEPLIDELTNRNGNGFPSIGNYLHHFQGSFEGQNHTLKNIYIHSYSNNGTPERTVVSLFGFITDATVKDLTITGDSFTEQKANIGGIASYASNVEIKNVHNYINITSNGDGYSVGGIIGSVGNDNIGLQGDNIRISNSSNHGTLYGGNHCGGLVGAIGENSHLFVESCYNAGTISNSIITDAGILALSNGNCYINNSYNIGEISTNSVGSDTATISLGGLVAANYGSTFVINSYNLGEVAYTGNSTANTSIAGLVGLTQGGAHVLNSYNQGNIKNNTTRNYVGGIANTVTWNNDVHKQIYNSYNTGTLSGGGTRYQIGYLLNGDIRTSYYKSGTGTGSNVSGTTEISDANMKLADGENTNSLLYLLNTGMKNISLDTIKNDLISHGYNASYFNLSLKNWIIDSKTGYPTLD